MIRYDKLIRDRIPEIIRENGSEPTTRILDNDEYLEALKNKLEEEVKEFLSSRNIEELADVVEVAISLSEHLGIGRKALEKIRKEKKLHRGGFHRKLFLEYVE